MKYNFDEVIDRHHTDAVKIERCLALFGTEEVLPLWVADMDFRTPDFIIDAIQQRIQHPILGYSMPPKEFYPLLMKWIKEHHNWEVKRSWIGFLPGIVPGLSFAVQCFTDKGDEIIVQPPVYYPFFHVVEKNKRKLICNQLKVEDGKYEMDFEDLESKITSKTKMLILCNPHNPGGKVWSAETLKRLDSICTKHNIVVISDEIHADMVHDGFTHIPYASISETAANNTVTFMAPSKVFNMPGLISSSYIIPNQQLREKFVDFLEASEIGSGNVFAYAATVAAYEKGEEWRKQMLSYVSANIKFITQYLEENIPAIVPMIPEASFLVWLNCSKLGMSTDELFEFFSKKAGLGLNKGTIFGPGGEYHLRLNVACPRSVLEKAMGQLKDAIVESTI